MKSMKLLVLALVLTVSGVIFAAGGDLGVSGGANGTQSQPYLIEDFNDFQVFCGDPNYWADGIYTRLDCDLDLDPNLSGRQIYAYAPIAGDPDATNYTFDGTVYAGHFDGNSYSIKNLNLNGKRYCGLFGRTDANSVIENVGLEQVNISSSSYYVAALVGYNCGNISDSSTTGVVAEGYYVGGLVGKNINGSINDCYSAITIVNGTDYVGGLVGMNDYGDINDCNTACAVDGGEYVGGLIGRNYGNIKGSSTSGAVTGYDLVGGLVGCKENGDIDNCCSTADVTGSDHIGGLVGHNEEDKITDSYATGAINGDGYVGGLIGGQNQGSISRCYATGDVTGSDSYVGGLIGSKNKGSIRNCYTTGEVTGIGYVGGLIGFNYSDSIGNCYAVGAVTGNSSVGGLVGKNYYGNISSCYATGVVTGNFTSGGLVGYKYSGYISNCYFYIDGGLDNGYGTALDDEQLQDSNSFVGFDFVDTNDDGSADIWAIEADHMPRLSWQLSPGFEAPYRLDSITTTLSGTGYPSDPFIIADYNDLIEFRNNTELRIGCYSLTADIDLAGITYTEAFIPEGFLGFFEGNGHVIWNLSIDGEGRLGFFSQLYGSAANLDLENASVAGSNYYVAVLAGVNNGDINNCYTSGDVTSVSSYVGGLVGQNEDNISNCCSAVEVASDDYVGGLVGQNDNGGTITDSYAIGSVTSLDDCAGGLVGQNEANINNCYATGEVTGNNHNGGLVGDNYYGNINNCYFYIYGGLNNGLGTALDDDQLQDSNSFVGFDFVDTNDDGSANIWAIEADHMPRLNWQLSPGFEAPCRLDSITTTLSGTGYSSDPFIIANYDDLIEFRNNTELRIGCYSLTADIDLAGITYTEAFIPESFLGSFAGNGYVIWNLSIDGEGSLGFFSQLYGSVVNLGLENASVTGSLDYVGGLAGENFGNISNCYTTGEVTCDDYIGGLVGKNEGDISNCYTTVAVTGDDYVGGLVGYNQDGDIINCYTTGEITGDYYFGGLVGKKYDGGISSSFWDVETSGIGSSGDDNYGAIGKTTVEMQTLSTFIDVGWDFSKIDGDPADWFMQVDDYPKLYWQFSIGYCGQTERSLEVHDSGIFQMEIDVYSMIDQTLNWTISGDGACSWIVSVDPNSGSSTGPADITTVSITVDATGFAVGDHLHKLTLSTDGGANVDIPVLVHIYNRIDLEEFAMLANYWMEDDCGDGNDCGAVDWYVDGLIDMFDLNQLSQSWLGEEIIYGVPKPDDISDDFETGDFAVLDWQFAEEADWVIDNQEYYNGGFSAKSGIITHYQQSELILTVDATGFDTISFARKVSSESGYDRLRFYIDGVEKNNWSGAQNWLEVSYPVTDGEHTFKWAYTKDGSASSGSDCAWIDDVIIFKSE